jgi:hypothetical protein
MSRRLLKTEQLRNQHEEPRNLKDDMFLILPLGKWGPL